MSTNILQVRSSFKVGGPEYLILKCMKRLAKTEFNFILSSFVFTKVENEFLKFAINENIRIAPILIKYSFDPSAITSLRKIIDQYEVKLVVAHDYRADIISYFAIRGINIPLIAVAHGWTSQNFKVKIFEYVEKIALRYMDKVIAVSNCKYRELLRIGLSPGKVEKIENCVEVPDKENITRTNQFKEELGLSFEDVLVGCVGRLSIEKGHRFLIEAAAKLKSKFPSTKYVIVGEGSEMGKLNYLAKKLDVHRIVYFTGQRSDLETIYRGIDIFVCPP